MTTKESKKDFDSFAMKRRAAQAIHQRLKDMSRKEHLDYWRERTEALRRRQRPSSDESSR